MRFQKLFKASAYPELDAELRRLLSRFRGKKTIVLVHVRLIHLNAPFDFHVLYLFSKKTTTVRGIKVKGAASLVGETIEFGKIIADFYSRRGKARVKIISHHFVTKSRWPY